jgi:hypothetical protein
MDAALADVSTFTALDPLCRSSIVSIVANAVVVVAQLVFLVQLKAYVEAQKEMERRCGEENSHDGLVDQLVWGTVALTLVMAAVLVVQVHRRATL